MLYPIWKTTLGSGTRLILAAVFKHTYRSLAGIQAITAASVPRIVWIKLEISHHSSFTQLVKLNCDLVRFAVCYKHRLATVSAPLPVMDCFKLLQSDRTSPVQWAPKCPWPGNVDLETTNGRRFRIDVSAALVDNSSVKPYMLCKS